MSETLYRELDEAIEYGKGVLSFYQELPLRSGFFGVNVISSLINQAEKAKEEGNKKEMRRLRNELNQVE